MVKEEMEVEEVVEEVVLVDVIDLQDVEMIVATEGMLFSRQSLSDLVQCCVFDKRTLSICSLKKYLL